MDVSTRVLDRAVLAMALAAALSACGQRKPAPGPRPKINIVSVAWTDITIQTAEVVDKSVDEEGRHLVHVKHKMANQKGVIMATGSAEIALPKRPA